MLLGEDSPIPEGAKAQSFASYLDEHNIRDPGAEHGTLGPSGHVSGAAQRATQARRDQEFAAYGQAQRDYAAAVDRGEIHDPTGRVRPRNLVAEQQAATSAEAGRLRRRAAELRHLADGGMRPRVHRREADRLEAEANRLEGK